VGQIFRVAILIGVLVLSTTTFAQSYKDERKQESPEQLLEGATEMMLRAFELILRSIPQYAPPEILENGDIIIRRIRPESEIPKLSPKDNSVPDQPKI
tara:strand:+ start:260 stop:553 length:294 start_codon:yes stop_codon:yes gene_type:complete